MAFPLKIKKRLATTAAVITLPRKRYDFALYNKSFEKNSFPELGRGSLRRKNALKFFVISLLILALLGVWAYSAHAVAAVQPDEENYTSELADRSANFADELPTIQKLLVFASMIVVIILSGWYYLLKKLSQARKPKRLPKPPSTLPPGDAKTVGILLFIFWGLVCAAGGMILLSKD